VDELIPGRVRGHVDLAINATFWVGAALGSLGSVVLLEGGFFSPDMGWRFAFGIGAVLGLGVLAMRRSVPESPRWLMLRGFEKDAEDIVADVERRVADTGATLPEPEGQLELEVRDHTPFSEIWKHMAHDERGRSLLGLSLMIAQSFFYNAVFFTYGLVLIKFYNVRAEGVAWYLLFLALGNFVGPLLLGRLFDTVGRKPMIAATYGITGLLLAITGFLFAQNILSAKVQTVAFAVIFFIASSAASAAYLTVSEIFPLEIRALAISIFYSAGTLVGGVGAPLLFGVLIESGSRTHLFWGYLLGAGLMIAAAVAELVLGVAAERQSLEKISKPLQSR
jgi:MFS family permease